MRFIKRLVYCIISMTLVIGMMYGSAMKNVVKAEESGTCGENLTWVLDDEGTLTISGTGNMTDYSFDSKAPWYASRETIKSVMIQNSVTSIGDYAFISCESMASITIPDSVISIGDDVLEYCSSLTSITIPESVASIGGWAFFDCDSLISINVDSNNSFFSSIDGVLFNKNQSELLCCPETRKGSYVIPDSVTSIKRFAFWDCDSLTSITIPESVTSIGSSSFRSCGGLTSITIPNSVTSIGAYAFYDCSSLTSIIIPDSVTIIEKDTFGGCSSLTSIIIPDSVTSIENNAFENCSNLTSITIPDSVTRIGEFAFFGCSSLTSITIPDGVTSIEYCAFDGCSSMTSFAIPDSVMSIDDYAFSDCSGLSSVTIPDSVTSIGEGAFNGCSSLTSITIPVIVTSIGKWAFCNCSSLTSIRIPDSVTNIGEYTLFGCSKLQSIYIPESVGNIDVCAFDGVEGTFYVKKDSYADRYLTGLGKNVSYYCFEGHVWDAEPTVDKTATCTEEGSKSIHCSVCGAKDESTITVIPKLEHTYGEWTVTEEATCTEAGSKEKVCSECGDKITETINATGHDWDDEYTLDKGATCVEDGSESIHCKKCGEIKEGTERTIPKTDDHNYGEWEVTKEATYTETGIKEHTCLICGDKQTEEIPMLTPGLSATKLTIYKSKKEKLVLNGVEGKITWKTSKKSVATVSSKGVVTAKKKGSATITVYVNKKKYATCKVTVKNCSIKVNKTKATVKVGNTYQIIATPTPEGTVTYTTTKKSVATVDKSTGLVTAKKKGTAYIKVKANGVTKKVKITVKK